MTHRGKPKEFGPDTDPEFGYSFGQNRGQDGGQQPGGVKDRLAISDQQMDSIRRPAEASRRWLGAKRPRVMHLGRSYQMWKNDPDLARRVNDFLARYADC